MPPTAQPLADGLTRLGLAFLGSAAEMLTRSLEIGARHLHQVVAPDDGVARPDLLRAGRRYLTEMATVPALALERLGHALDPSPAPAAEPRRIMGHSIPLPAHVHDAAQGVAIYAVPRAVVSAILAERKAPFVPADLGHERTGLVVTGVRYRASDLGVYDEVGLAFIVAPVHDSTATGMYFFAMPVNGRLSRMAGTTIWGYPKTEEILDVTLQGARATWTLRRRSGRRRVLSIGFPRGGRSASSAIGLSNYTLHNGRPVHTQFVRTGRGERTLAGAGAVTLSLGQGGAGARDPLVVLLRRLGLPSAPVILHSWTEHMSGELGPPRPLRGHDSPAQRSRRR